MFKVLKWNCAVYIVMFPFFTFPSKSNINSMLLVSSMKISMPTRFSSHPVLKISCCHESVLFSAQHHHPWSERVGQTEADWTGFPRLLWQSVLSSPKNRSLFGRSDRSTFATLLLSRSFAFAEKNLAELRQKIIVPVNKKRSVLRNSLRACMHHTHTATIETRDLYIHAYVRICVAK